MQIGFVGATNGRPPELWLNHKFDICFWYEKSLINQNGRTQFAPTE